MAATQSIEQNGRQYYIDKIRRFYKSVDRYDMRAKARKIEHLLILIFDREDSNPEQKRRTSRLLSTYLPTITKAMDRYVEMQKGDLQGEGREQMQKSVNELLNLSIQALSEIQEKMYADDVIDTSVDVKVMKTLMQQEGLISDTDFLIEVH